MNKLYLSENDLATAIIGLSMKVHTTLGPGLLENTYKHCLHYEIAKAKMSVQIEKPIPLIYQSVNLDCGYRSDLLVENLVILEIKSVEALTDIHLAQTLTYLRLGNYKLGLLLNFNVLHMRDGIKRVVNNLRA